MQKRKKFYKEKLEAEKKEIQDFKISNKKLN
jgi:hypothetical protein